MDFKILYPKLIPESWLIDLPKSNHQPVDKPLITPPPPYMFNSIDYPAESTLYCIRRHRDPAFSLKSVIKNQKGIPRKIPLNIRSLSGTLWERTILISSSSIGLHLLYLWLSFLKVVALLLYSCQLFPVTLSFKN